MPCSFVGGQDSWQVWFDCDVLAVQVSGATKQETARLRQQARAELARESYENFLQNQNQAEV